MSGDLDHRKVSLTEPSWIHQLLGHVYLGLFYLWLLYLRGLLQASSCAFLLLCQVTPQRQPCRHSAPRGHVIHFHTVSSQCQSLLSNLAPCDVAVGAPSLQELDPGAGRMRRPQASAQPLTPHAGLSGKRGLPWAERAQWMPFGLWG